MKVRLPLALIVAVVGVGLIPGPVAAGPPAEEEFSPVGDRFRAGRPSSRSKAAPCWSANMYMSLARVFPTSSSSRRRTT
jgi:hypothetical protein